MDLNEISFENLPKAVAHLVTEVAELKVLVEKGQTPVENKKRVPIVNLERNGMDEQTNPRSI